MGWVYSGPLRGPYPVGVVARNVLASTTAAVTNTPTLAVKTTVQLDASRCYKLWTSQVLIESTAAGDYGQLRLVMSAVNANLPAVGASVAASTLLALDNAKIESANVAATTVGCAVELNAPATGTYQLGVAYFRNSGSGSVKLNLAAGRSLSLVVEDIGPAVAATS